MSRAVDGRFRFLSCWQVTLVGVFVFLGLSVVGARVVEGSQGETDLPNGKTLPIDGDSLHIDAQGGLSADQLRRAWHGSTLEAQVASLQALLLAKGYLGATTVLTLSHALARPEAAQLAVEFGPKMRRWDLSHRVRGPHGVDVDSLAARVGPPITDAKPNREGLEKILRVWVREWAELGFPFAVASVDSVKATGDRAEVGLSLEVGGRKTWGELNFPGLRSTRPSFLAQLLRLKEGEPFRQSSLERAELRLERVGLFSRVGIPELETLEGGRLRVHFPIEEGPHNRVEGAVGYAGESESVNGWVSLELGNLFGTGRSLDLRWDRLSEERNLLDLSYREPLLLGWPVATSLRVQQEVRDSTYTLDQVEGVFEIELGSEFLGELGGEWRRSVIGLEPNSELVRRTSSLLGLRWDTERPTRFLGSRVGGRFLSGRSRIRDRDGVTRRERVDRVEMSLVHWYVPRPGWRVLFAGKSAGLSGQKDRALPLSEALWVGGSATLRGFPEQAFATRRFAVSRLEAGRVLSGEPGRVYVFLDGGWFRELADGREDRREIGWGVGIANEGQGRSMVVDFGIPGGGSLSSGRLHLRLATRF